MIYGETGTGKGILLRVYITIAIVLRIHLSQLIAALPESILESELFGYASGAFTGARREGRAGILR